MMNSCAYNSILDTVGNTPLVRLNKITRGIESHIYAKLEFMNPMGSIKDRIALNMIEKAEKEGTLKKGQLIIESSSGNTALGLALVAIQKGYKLKVLVKNSISKDKINLLRSLGVDVHTVDHTLPPESPDNYNNIAPKLAAEIPNCYFTNQHCNPTNPESHFNSTGPEIWEQMDGNIDYLVAGMGTGGTMGGTAKYLKKQNPKVKIIAVDSEGSIYYDYFYKKKSPTSTHYLVEGVGGEFVKENIDYSNVDEVRRVSDKDAFHCARRLVKDEGILAGGSSGAALFATLKLARELPKSARIVTIFPDSASRYLSTIFSDEWMQEKNLL